MDEAEILWNSAGIKPGQARFLTAIIPLKRCFCHELNRGARHRVSQAQLLRMQQQARRSGLNFCGRVERVAENRMPERLQMHAKLV